ncbi:MAG: TIGR02206 family membrane protein [Peptostreptococcaceae bacterium]
MELINNFFTTTSNEVNFITFGKIHFMLLLIALLGSINILINKKESRNFEIFVGSVLVIQQVILYSWYLATNYNLITQGLPLYHCRIAILFVGIGMLFNKKNLMKLGSYLGIFGSISALLFPGLDPFSFPHMTQFSFFIGHIFLLWGSLYLLFVKNIGMSKVDFNKSLIFINVYHVLMFILNNAVSSNYGYMNSPPISALNSMNTFIYSFGVIITFNIIFSIEYFLLNRDSLIGGLLNNPLEKVS